MTEKNYGGSSNIPKGKLVITKNNSDSMPKIETKTKEHENAELTEKTIKNYKKAGEIAQEVVKYAKSIIKKNEKLLDIAEKIEAKIIALGGKPAFPCNLSINEIAAHYTPSYDDKNIASGLLKVDLGVSVNGYIADTAFSIDLENSEENKKLILASDKALQSAIETAKSTKQINLIGQAIHRTITSLGLSPIRNLSGHELGKNVIHAGITIPNYDNGNEKILEEGAYAIEPFATSGMGLVYDSKPSGIYRLEKISGIRDLLARKILAFVQEEYQTLPFCSRWIIKKFGERAKYSLSLLEQQEIIYQYPQLVEKAHSKVSQAEHTTIITNKVEITT